MRIAFLTVEFVTEKEFDGGLSNYLDRVTRALADRGHNVELFVTSFERKTFKHGRIIVHRIPRANFILLQVFRLLRKLRILPLPNFLSMLLASHELGLAFKTRHSESPFDVAQSSNYLASGFFLGLQRTVPLVTRISNYGNWGRHASAGNWDLELCKLFESLLLKNSSACFAPSRLMADVVNAAEKIPVEVIETPYLENVESDPAVANTLRQIKGYALFFGTLSRRKGAGVLAEAIPNIIDRIPDFKIVLAGKIGDEAGRKLAGLTARYAKNVHYLGVLPPRQLHPVVRQSIAVVLPSLEDNMPNACIESMHAGRVVIGTYGASFDEIIDDGLSGFLVNRGDIQGLIRALTMVWQLDASDRAKIGREAQNRTLKLRPEAVIPKLEEFYQRVAASRQLDPAY